MRIVTFSTLYPNANMPTHGIFVENRLRQLIAHERIESTVIAPVPYFPSSRKIFRRWAKWASVPSLQIQHGIQVRHPRFLVVPKIGQLLTPKSLFLAARRSLQELIETGYKPRLIDAHYLYPDGVAAVQLGKAFQLPVVVTARGSDVTEWPYDPSCNRLIREAISNADALIAVSSALADGLKNLGANPERVTVLRNGVDTNVFAPVDYHEARKQLQLRRKMLLSVGHLIVRKGHDRVIRALVELPEFELMIVGDGPERAALLRLAAVLNVADRVHLVGSVVQAKLPLYYSAAEALILASSREGWANVLLEAMACGTPVIASPISGNSEVVRKGEAGVITKENSPAGIVEAVRGLLSKPPSRIETQIYAASHGWREVSAGQRQVFESVIDGKNNRRHAYSGKLEQFA
jgi:glycosyltransferase involved in cell wall biosynthesis